MCVKHVYSRASIFRADYRVVCSLYRDMQSMRQLNMFIMFFFGWFSADSGAGEAEEKLLVDRRSEAFFGPLSAVL